jgi:hypothetical protein
MSGDGKRGVGHWPQATAPIFDSTIGYMPTVGTTTAEIEGGTDQIGQTEAQCGDQPVTLNRAGHCHGFRWLSALLSGDGGFAGAQNVLLHLARRRLRQLIDEADPLRRLERSDRIAHVQL